MNGRLLTSILEPAAPERNAFETELLQSGARLPVQDRTDWPADAPEAAFVAVRDAGGAPALGFSVREYASNALPGYSLLRVRRLGGSTDPNALRAGIHAAVGLARTRARVLRLSLELFLPDAAARAAISAECVAIGFAPAAVKRTYEETIIIDVQPAGDKLFASLTKTGRQNIRAVDRNPVALRTIADDTLAPRLEALLAETMARTGGGPRPMDWPRIIAFCERHPRAARLVGLFDERPGIGEPLLAFALAYNHGDYAEYATAASTRQTDLRMPLAYGLAWDLMLWSKTAGACWFDFGGVTRGTADSGDALGGISDFKRYFSRTAVQVGAEFDIEPRTLPAAMAKASVSVSRWISDRMRPRRPESAIRHESR
jgi:hypothetical protein